MLYYLRWVSQATICHSVDIDPIPSIVHFGWLIDLSKQSQLSRYTRDAWILFISLIVIGQLFLSGGQ